MDRIGADYYNVIEQMPVKLGAQPLPLQIPLGQEADFRGVIDLLSMREIVWNDETLGAEYQYMGIEPDYFATAREARDKLVARGGRVGRPAHGEISCGRRDFCF